MLYQYLRVSVVKTEALVRKINQATLAEQKLIAQILDAPQALQHVISTALSEGKKKKIGSQFLEAMVDLSLQVGSSQVDKDIDISDTSAFEKLVKALTTKEVLAKLAPSDPLSAARLKGMQVKRKLLYGDGHPLTSEEVASLLHLTRQAIDKRRKKGQLLAVSLGRRGYLYPIWQFHEDKVLPGIEQVLAELETSDPWSQLIFFTTGNIRLDGATPLECLQAGDIDRIVRAASCYGKQIAA